MGPSWVLADILSGLPFSELLHPKSGIRPASGAACGTEWGIVHRGPSQCLASPPPCPAVHGQRLTPPFLWWPVGSGGQCPCSVWLCALFHSVISDTPPVPAPPMKVAAGSLPPTTTGLHPEVQWETEIWGRIKTSRGLGKGTEINEREIVTWALMLSPALCPVDYQSYDFLGPVLGPSMTQPASHTGQSHSLALTWHFLGHWQHTQHSTPRSLNGMCRLRLTFLQRLGW